MLGLFAMIKRNWSLATFSEKGSRDNFLHPFSIFLSLGLGTLGKYISSKYIEIGFKERSYGQFPIHCVTKAVIYAVIS